MRIGYQELEDLIYEIMHKAGLTEQDAHNMANILVRTEAKGVYSHGAQLIEGYVKNVESGMFNVHPNIQVKDLAPGLAIVDGDKAIGYTGATRVVEIGIEKARQVGCATVCGVNMNHFGAGLAYAEMAVENNMILILYCNALAMVAPFASREKYFGTNPYTFGAPCGKLHPYILDMATTMGAGNKLIALRREGINEAPAGWGIDRNGQPTTDIAEIMDHGSMVPFGGIKGSGLAGLVGIMSGVLSGSEYYRDDVGFNQSFTMQLIDVQKFMPLEEFTKRMDTYCGDILNLKPAQEGGHVYYPGYLEGERRKKALVEGIELSNSTVIAVRHAAEYVGIPLNF